MERSDLERGAALAMNRILLVEDDREISVMLKNFLTTENFEVVTAFDGKSACDTFFEGVFSLVLLDLILPITSIPLIFGIIRSSRTRLKTPSKNVSPPLSSSVSPLL